MAVRWQGRLRSIFAFSFPLLLGALFYLMFAQADAYLYRQTASEKRNQLLEQSRNVMARIQTEFSLSAQIEKVFRQIIEEFYAHDDQTNPAAMQQLAEIYQRKMPADFASNARVWAFWRSNQKFDTIDQAPFLTHKRAAMARVFAALIDLNDTTPGKASGKTSERFIVGVFGENSAPEYLATSHPGKLTPVIFEGRPHYLFWQKLEHRGVCLGGLIALFAADWTENQTIPLQRLSEQIYTESSGELIAAFTLARVIDKSFKPIMASGAEQAANSSETLQVLQSAREKGSKIPSRQLHESSGYWLYRDLIADTSPHTAWLLIKKTGETAATANTSVLPVSLTFVAWALLYWYKRRKSGFELNFAFRLLFFMTGMLPVLALLLLGLELIDQSAAAKINDRIQIGFDKLKTIDEKSEDLTSLAGLLLKDVFSNNKIQEQLISTTESVNHQGFANVEKMLRLHKFTLSYLLMFKPGHEIMAFATTPKNLAQARYHGEYLAISCHALHRKMLSSIAGYEPILLSPSQKTTLKAFAGADTQSTMDVFLDSLERISIFEGDNNDRQLVYSAILTRDGHVTAYLVAGLSLATTLLEMISEELQFAETGSDNLFVCLNRDISTGQKIYPDHNLKFFNSQSGQLFRKFLESAATSNYQMQMHKGDAVYIYEPLARVKLYYAGAVLPINDINRENEVKRILLFALATVLAGSIYLLSASVSSLIIRPTRRLAEVFTAIAEGSFAKTFVYRHNNELGMLARATDSMISGLKERKLLGKFVSRTFDNEVLNITNTESARELYGVILFSDIRNFTTLSESNSAETIAELLNNHLKEMVEIINHGGGEIEQFIGDAIVAFFPGEGETSCRKALEAARHMMLQHQKNSAARKKQSKLTCEIGIGLDYGLVMAGIIKSGSRSEFCVIGPARACAENFEGLSKSGRYTRIIAGHSVTSQLPEVSSLMAEHASGCCELKTLEKTL